jgi:CxxC motif-containing protein
MTKPITCIICPKGCLITVNAQTSPWITDGNACPRGATYAIQETADPRRTLTATVAIAGAAIPRCPVVTSAPIPKGELLTLMTQLNRLTIHAPVIAGSILVENFAGEGIHLLATRTLENTHAA